MARVIYFASSYGVGLTALLVEKACALRELDGSEFLFVSGQREQFPGLFAKLKRHQVRQVAIPGLDDHGGFFRLVRSFNNEVERFSPSIVHVQTNWQLAIAAAARRLFGQRYAIICTIHGYRHNYKIRSVIARAAIGVGLKALADLVLAPSSFLRNKFSIVRKKLRVLFLGVEDRYFDRGEIVSWNGPARIIYPAEFRKGKNHEELIRSIGKVIETVGSGNLELYLPGTGALLEGCQTLSRRIGLEDVVFFPGLLDRSKLLDLYLKCQFVVVPAGVETFGLAIAEGLVLGRVVVSRPVGVAQDVIVHGETGYLYESDAELEALLCSLIHDQGRCEGISRNALKARDVFRWRNICEQYERILVGLERAA
jgi:glycosyltransferase involved in cell wall biosynthesis